jgi:hypothetical protein
MSMERANENTRLPGAVPPGAIPVEAFNPLLRSLLSWELVNRVEDPDGSRRWVLTPEAQERLDALAPRPRRSSASLAYLDHWCARCRQQRLTHLIEGRFLCEECERAESGDVARPAPQPKLAHHAHDLLNRRRDPHA